MNGTTALAMPLTINNPATSESRIPSSTSPASTALPAKVLTSSSVREVLITPRACAGVK